MPESTERMCQCENDKHFRSSFRVPSKGHPYGAEFLPSGLCTVATPYGDFTVCRECATTCLCMFPIKGAH